MSGFNTAKKRCQIANVADTDPGMFVGLSCASLIVAESVAAGDTTEKSSRIGKKLKQQHVLRLTNRRWLQHRFRAWRRGASDEM